MLSCSRDRFHHYTGSKFKDIRSLFSRLDRDHDGKVLQSLLYSTAMANCLPALVSLWLVDLWRQGQVSMKEWVLGLQDLNFPITEGEAVKMFRAIDVNNE